MAFGFDLDPPVIVDHSKTHNSVTVNWNPSLLKGANVTPPLNRIHQYHVYFSKSPGIEPNKADSFNAANIPSPLRRITAKKDIDRKSTTFDGVVSVGSSDIIATIDGLDSSVEYHIVVTVESTTLNRTQFGAFNQHIEDVSPEIIVTTDSDPANIYIFVSTYMYSCS